MRRKHDFSITQQVAETMALEIVDDTGAPRNLSTYDFKLDCRQQPSAENVLFSLSSADSTIMLDTNHNNKLWLVFKHSLTKTLSFDKGFYDLLAYTPDLLHVEILMSGMVTLNHTVTKLD